MLWRGYAIAERRCDEAGWSESGECMHNCNTVCLSFVIGITTHLRFIKQPQGLVVWQ